MYALACLSRSGYEVPREHTVPNILMARAMLQISSSHTTTVLGARWKSRVGRSVGEDPRFGLWRDLPLPVQKARRRRGDASDLMLLLQVRPSLQHLFISGPTWQDGIMTASPRRHPEKVD